ncbi:mechanosensitive ion channel domain-containing protein [Rhizosphaericola mali]|nr:mechanosensitive ion channel domain-containing protein [Rhizosphaericola mali]
MSFFCASTLQAQRKKEAKKKDTLDQIILDSLKRDTMSIVATKEDTIAIQKAVLGDTLIPFVANKVEKYNATIHYSHRSVRDTLDMSDLMQEVAMVNKIVDKMQTRIEKGNRNFNIQMINTSIILLTENLNDLDPKSESLANYASRLMQNNRDVKRILKDPIFKLTGLSTDLKVQLNNIYQDGQQLDTSEIALLTRINLARNQTSTAILKLNDLLSDLKYMEENKYFQMWKPDAPSLFKLKSNYYQQPFWATLGSSFSRTFKIVGIYLKRKIGVLCWGMFFLLVTGIISWNNRRKIKKNEDYETIMTPVKYFKRSILLTTLFAFCNYFPFFFLNPPYSFLNLVELIQLVLFVAILWPYLLFKGRIMILISALICVGFILDNQLLDPTFGERWLLFLLCIALILTNLAVFKFNSSYTSLIAKSWVTNVVMIISIIFAVFSLLFNLGGLTTPMKLFGFTSIQVLIIGVSMRMFCQVALEFIYIQTEANKGSRFSAFINYIELKSKYMRIFAFIGMVAWCIGIFHSMNLYGLFLFIVDFIFNHHIHIGQFDFTFYSIFIFVFVIWVSSIVSRFVSFALGGDQDTSSTKRNKLGTMTLLIRLSILTIGFLIAIAASGIPLDKITLIIGALGVGIGFGLQNIVNNLVSGIILAFERPIQVGDSIEIGDKSGTVSEIGVRSSKLKVTEGADVIVPNGDLISQQITNWTLKDRRKRDFFSFRIAYGTDLYLVKKLVSDVFEENKNVLKNPPVAITISEFASTAVIMKAFFWVSELDDIPTIKGNLMYAVYARLLEHNIQIPHDPYDLGK